MCVVAKNVDVWTSCDILVIAVDIVEKANSGSAAKTLTLSMASVGIVAAIIKHEADAIDASPLRVHARCVEIITFKIVNDTNPQNATAEAEVATHINVISTSINQNTSTGESRSKAIAARSIRVVAVEIYNALDWPT
jgi:hypothetical protein